MKKYVYTEQQINQLLGYLGEKPAKEVLSLVQVLYSPVEVLEEQQQQTEGKDEQGQEVRQG